MLVSACRYVRMPFGLATKQLVPWKHYQLEISGQGRDTEQLHDLFHFGGLAYRFNVIEVTVLQANLLAKTTIIEHKYRGLKS
jgi:hypothetical protein